ncbi:MAG TPA: PPOX class F420-dependent oxidoreductase [Anaerolineae bacterium]
MQTMTPAEYKAFLLDTVRTGKLATVRQDGRPHIVPMWFDIDGDDLIFTTWHKSVKAVNMQRDPRVCLCIDDETPPFAYVQIEGMAAFSDDMAELSRWATRIGGRYMGADQAEAYGRRNSVEGELVVRITPTKIIARSGIAD